MLIKSAGFQSDVFYLDINLGQGEIGCLAGETTCWHMAATLTMEETVGVGNDGADH